jgi:ribose transport system permease protein
VPVYLFRIEVESRLIGLIGPCVPYEHDPALSCGRLQRFRASPAMTAVRGLARFLGSDNTVFNSDLSFAFIGNGTLFGVPWLMVIALATVVVSWIVLRRTVLGVRIYAVGGKPRCRAAVRDQGLVGPAFRLRRFRFACRTRRGHVGGQTLCRERPQLGQSYELDAIAALILGGTSFVGGVGSIWGTLVGAMIIAVLSNGLILTGVSDIGNSSSRGSSSSAP